MAEHLRERPDADAGVRDEKGGDAEKNGRAREGGSSGILWFLGPVIVAVVVALFVKTYVVTPYVVPTGSMLETIQEGDMLLGECVTLHFQDPEQDDIVTFRSPLDGETLIKRVVAVGGQTIDLVDGEVYVDGERLDEPYTGGKPTYSLSEYVGSAGIEYPYVVPEGAVWVMGDNRTDSRDSRYFGPVDVDDVTSRALFIYWPPSDIGGL